MRIYNYTANRTKKKNFNKHFKLYKHIIIGKVFNKSHIPYIPYISPYNIEMIKCI